MFENLKVREGVIISRAGRWEEVIERLEQLDADDESGALDLAPLVVEIKALTREARARARIYDPRRLYGDDGAFTSPERALEYLTKCAEDARVKIAQGAGSGITATIDEEFELREAIDGVATLLRGPSGC